MVNLRGYGLLATLGLVWGLAFVAIRRADFELSFVNLTLLRWMLVSLVFLVFYPFVVKPKTRLEGKDVPRLVMVSLANVVVYHLSLNYAEKIVSASLSGLLISLGPVFTVILSSVLLRERVGRRLILAVILALVGTALISLPDMDLGFATALGPLAVVLSAFMTGLFAVVSKPLVTKYGAFPVAIWVSLVGTACLLPLASPSLVQEAASLSAYGWTSVLFLVVFSTIIGNLVVFTMIGKQAVSRVGVQLYLVPLVSVVGGVAILGESLGLFTILGGTLLLSAVALATTARR